MSIFIRALALIIPVTPVIFVHHFHFKILYGNIFSNIGFDKIADCVT